MIVPAHADRASHEPERDTRTMSLEEIAQAKIHHTSGSFLNPFSESGIHRRNMLELITWKLFSENRFCLLYTSDAADDLLCVDLGGRRIIKKKISPTH